MDIILQGGHVRRTDVFTTAATPWRPEEVEITHRDGNYQVGFTKPDTPIINRKVNGWRSPSAYQVQAFSKDNGYYITNNPLLLRYSQEGRGEFYEGTELHVSGDGFARVVRNSAAPNVNELRMKVLNNVRDEVLDVAMVLAEMQSTVGTLSGNLNRLGRSMLAFRRGKPRHFNYLLNGRSPDGRRPTQKFLKETAGLYLEWKYGIMPTLYDIQGACKALDINEEGSLFDNPPLLVARAIVKDKIVKTLPFGVGSATGQSPDKAPRVTLTTERSIKARLDYRVTAEGVRGLNRYGLGLGTVATVLWDRHPFTFVLDMAMPVAGLIKAWTALGGTDVLGYTETDYQSWTLSADDQTVHYRSVPVVVSTTKQKTFEFNRRVFNQPPMPVPFVKNPIKTGNLATVLALFTQLRKNA